NYASNYVPGAYNAGWVEMVYPYCKNSQMWWCPSEVQAQIQPPDYTIAGNKRFTTYFYNSNFNCGWQSSGVTATNGWSKRESAIDSPSVVVMLGDGGAYSGDPFADCFSNTLSDCPDAIPHVGTVTPPGMGAWNAASGWNTPAQALAEQSRHLDGGNYTFADG